MANLKSILSTDPTLDASDRALEAKAALESPRPYLGMSQIAESCSRKSWYRFRFAAKEIYDAQTLKRFEDGHRTEALVIERLRLVEGLTLIDIDPETGKQIGFIDCNGHFRGHADGSAIGLIQAPKALHVFEAKCTSEKKLNELKKAIADVGEKAALKKWNPVYYGQGMLYCHYMQATRHWLVVATPGGRDWIGVRTNYDHAEALKLKAKANRVIQSNDPLDKISNTSDWFECRYCAFSGICHGDDMPIRNCRTCVHSTAMEHGTWHCERFGKSITLDEQLVGCPAHKYLTGLVPGQVKSVIDEPPGIIYQMNDGSEWYDGEVSDA